MGRAGKWDWSSGNSSWSFGNSVWSSGNTVWSSGNSSAPRHHPPNRGRAAEHCGLSLAGGARPGALGLILASTCTGFAFLTQQGCPGSAEGLAGAPSRPARTPRGTRPGCAVYKTAKWKPKDLSLIPPVKSSRFLLATSHLIPISKSWPSSPDPAERAVLRPEVICMQNALVMIPPGGAALIVISQKPSNMKGAGKQQRWLGNVCHQ